MLSAEEQSRAVMILREHLLDVDDVEANQSTQGAEEDKDHFDQK